MQPQGRNINVKGNRQCVTQDDLDRIKQFPVKSALFSRGSFSGFYDESTGNFYVMDQYGRLTGAVAKVPKEKFESVTPGPREDTVDEYRRQKNTTAASAPTPVQPSVAKAPASQASGASAKSDDAAKRSATVFQKKKRRTGLVVGLIVAGAVLLTAGVVAAQYFGVLQILSLDFRYRGVYLIRPRECPQNEKTPSVDIQSDVGGGLFYV